MTTAPDPTTIVKTMTLSAGEFAKSIAAFTGGDVAITDKRATVVVNDKGGSAEITFEPLPPRRVGGLLELPQARVTITLAKVSAAQLDTFLRRFDLAFQRGGG